MEEEGRRKVSPEVNASFFTRITNGWLDEILRLGYERPLNPEDLYELDESFKTTVVGEQLDEAWRVRSGQEGKWPLYWALSDAFGKKLYLSGILKFFGDCATMASPYVLRMLVRTMMMEEASGQGNRMYGFGLCILLFLLQLTSTVTVNAYFSTNFRVGMRARTALNSAIYRKTHTLSGPSRQEFSTGQIINMVSTDSSRIEMGALFLHYLWSGPLQIVVMLGILYGLIGPSMFVGLVLFAISIPIQSKITSWLSKFRKVSSYLLILYVLSNLPKGDEQDFG